MTIIELYREIGGNYNEVNSRLTNCAFIEKFITKFPKDNSFKSLCKAIKDGNREDAFRAAHTLKGICLNLGLGDLLLTVNEITDILRPETYKISEKTDQLLKKVRCEYNKTVDSINLYMKENAH